MHQQIDTQRSTLLRGRLSWGSPSAPLRNADRRRTLLTSDNRMDCHGLTQNGVDPYSTWSGSLMAHAGRDPLFKAQMVTANQDVAIAV